MFLLADGVYIARAALVVEHLCNRMQVSYELSEHLLYTELISVFNIKIWSFISAGASAHCESLFRALYGFLLDINKTSCAPDLSLRPCRFFLERFIVHVPSHWVDTREAAGE